MFSLEGKVWDAISRVGDLVILNILFFICCIPVVTIGAAVTALYSVTKKMAENREGYIFRGYFKAFRENFKQSTVMWLIMLVVIAVLSVDLYIGNFLEKGMGQTVYRGVILLALFVAMFELLYALTLQCTFENTIKNTMKNALLISLGHAPYSVLMVLLTVSPFAALLYVGEYFSMELLAMLLIWFSGVAYINSFFLNRIYKKYS